MESNQLKLNVVSLFIIIKLSFDVANKITGSFKFNIKTESSPHFDKDAETLDFDLGLKL